MKMKDPVVVVSGGCGTVGSALVELLRPHTTIVIDDPKYYRPPTTTSLLSSVNLPGWFEKCDFLHVCIPYFGGFVEKIKLKQRRFKPEVTIIHSTVPVGTSRKLNAVHSPVMGQHDELEKSMKQFTKFVSGEHLVDVKAAAQHLINLGLKCKWYDDGDGSECMPESTEILKLLCSVRFYNDLAFYQFSDEFLSSKGMPVGLLELWTEEYNSGYSATGQARLTRPQLDFPRGKIGGTCVKQNVEMLKKSEGIEMNFLAELESKDDS